jgi:hypothetical protein
MNRKNLTRALAAPFLMAMVMSVSTSTPAAAQSILGNDIIHSAAMCVAPNDNSQYKPIDMRVSLSGVVSNGSTTNPLWVVCPMPRTGNITPWGTYVWVFDGHPGSNQNVGCTFMLANPNGTVADYASGQSTKLSTTTNPEELPLYKSPEMKVFVESRAHIACLIPPTFVDSQGVRHPSGINAYQLKTVDR